MPFSHHSHSGQFCGHATGTLEDMIQTAIVRKMSVFCLTEHMPREDRDLYPEETALSLNSTELFRIFSAYHAEASRLRTLYEGQITLLIGLEADWFPRPTSAAFISSLLSLHAFDFYVGSLHHVHSIPIDYDTPLYQAARAAVSGSDASDERLFEHYFDEQYQMLQQMRPPVVGHFDLIRLKSDDPERRFTAFKGVWERVLRNLELVAGYGGIVEINSSAVRKGMSEPYPKREICEAFRDLGGRFTLSDDSHAPEQVGLNYHRVLQHLKTCGIETVYYLHRDDDDGSTSTSTSTSAVTSAPTTTASAATPAPTSTSPSPSPSLSTSPPHPPTTPPHSGDPGTKPLDPRFPHTRAIPISVSSLAHHAFFTQQEPGYSI
ncbi:MAG: hypothetical protein M1819_003396 [Sarea resinae]|nr:MAG: hypothetical protein M1819_003396 [Sarea resinae]